MVAQVVAGGTPPAWESQHTGAGPGADVAPHFFRAMETVVVGGEGTNDDDHRNQRENSGRHGVDEQEAASAIHRAGTTVARFYAK